MMQARWIKEIAGTAALAVLVAVAPAHAQDDDSGRNSIWNLEDRVWGNIARTLGLRDPNTPEIEYRERSPLVVPPSNNLPTPQAKATPKNPAWPNDPDVSRARKAAEAKKKRNAGTDLSRTVDRQSNPILPSDLDRGGAPAPTASDRSNAPTPGSDPSRPVNPSELGYFGGLFSGRAWGFGGYANETGTFTNEPTRDQLTQPPPGYQTPSPDQPYGTTRRVERQKTEQFDPARQ